MPGSSGTLVLFLLLVLPGLVYSRRRELRMPPGTVSGFRETANTVVIGVGAQLPVLALIATGRVIAPSITIDLRLVATRSAPYIESHFTIVVAWAVAGAVLSCLAAAAWAVPPAAAEVVLARLPEELKPSGLGLRDRPLLLPGSAWTEEFAYYPDKYTTVGCRLLDGSHVEGNLGSYNPSLTEGSERDLVLVAPISYAPAPDVEPEPWEGVGQVIVSSRDIQLLTVSYSDEPTG